MTASPAAQRLARHRREMQRAMADNCSLDEARNRIARDDWQAGQERAAQRIRCGTEDMAPSPPADRADQDIAAPQPRRWWIEADL